MSDPQPVPTMEQTMQPAAVPVAVAPTAGLEPSASTEIKLDCPLEKSVQTDKPPSSWLWLTKHDQTFVAVFVAGFVMLTGYHWATLGGWGMRPIEIERQPARQYDFRIDINSASWVEWTQIEGIGETTAQKIISDREAKGPFRSINDLRRVKGIGPKTLEKMRPFLREPTSENSATKLAP